MDGGVWEQRDEEARMACIFASPGFPFRFICLVFPDSSRVMRPSIPPLPPLPPPHSSTLVSQDLPLVSHLSNLQCHAGSILPCMHPPTSKIREAMVIDTAWPAAQLNARAETFLFFFPLPLLLRGACECAIGSGTAFAYLRTGEDRVGGLRAGRVLGRVGASLEDGGWGWMGLLAR